MSSTILQQVNNETTQALQLLSQVKETMLKLLSQMSTASMNSLTVEPDLEQLQKYRKEYETLMTQLKTKVNWIQEHQQEVSHKDNNNSELEQTLLEEQQQLQQTSRNISDKLKHILSQTYALQLQTDVLLSASYNQPVQ
ncbi:unnamed protein product [Cunninghamella blakesleeana]